MKLTRRRTAATAAVALTTALALTGCAGMSQWGEDVNRALKGTTATITTYNEDGAKIDQATGASIRVSRDERFDTSDSDGVDKNDSSVLMISIGESHISHVGSCMVIAQDGLDDLTASIGESVNVENTEAGRPWLNDLRERHQNLWAGKAKTILIRSQAGNPVAVFAGEEVEGFATDVPKSTAFRVDGKYLFVYRCDYTTYDTDLLD